MGHEAERVRFNLNSLLVVVGASSDATRSLSWKLRTFVLPGRFSCFLPAALWPRLRIRQAFHKNKCSRGMQCLGFLFEQEALYIYVAGLQVSARLYVVHGYEISASVGHLKLLSLRCRRRRRGR